jgi:cytochrome c-type biogenesis protein CcmF
MLEGREVRIGAELLVQEYGKKPVKVIPAKVITQGEAHDEPATFADLYRFTIVNMQPDRENKENSRVEIGYAPVASTATEDQTDILVVEASVKPYINLVWSGVIILMVGFIVTIVRRAQEARLREHLA